MPQMAAVTTTRTQRRQSAHWCAANVAAEAQAHGAASCFSSWSLRQAAAGAGVGNFGCLKIRKGVHHRVFLNLGPLLQEFPIVQQIWRRGGGVKFTTFSRTKAKLATGEGGLHIITSLQNLKCIAFLFTVVFVYSLYLLSISRRSPPFLSRRGETGHAVECLRGAGAPAWIL